MFGAKRKTDGDGDSSPKRKKVVGYFGEGECTVPECSMKPYYRVPGYPTLDAVCGRHCTKFKGSRVSLPKNPNRNAILAVEAGLRDVAAQEVAKLCKKGALRCRRQRMMQTPILGEACVAVFPNNRAGVGPRNDGSLGAADLSPMRLGPCPTPGFADRGPGLAESRTIEAFHQFRKVFQEEIDRDGDHIIMKDGSIVQMPNKAFFATLAAEFATDKPSRHKPAAKGPNKNIPAYQLYRASPTHKWQALEYVESRQLYCREYERLAPLTSSYKHLTELHGQGITIEIWGYDGHMMELPADCNVGVMAMELTTRYHDPSFPFGHEMVLLTMLALPPALYPWTVYATLE